MTKYKLVKSITVPGRPKKTVRNLETEMALDPNGFNMFRKLDDGRVAVARTILVYEKQEE